MRAKLDVKWRHGIVLGRAMGSDQNYIGLRDGSVVCARAMVRLIPARRWNLNIASGITGAPTDLKTENMDIIETEVNPHKQEDPDAKQEESIQAKRRLKITAKGLRDHGYSDKCPRCDVQNVGQYSRAK